MTEQVVSADERMRAFVGALERHVRWLLHVVSTWEELVGDERARNEAKRVAPQFYQTTRSMLENESMLAIGRLTDRPSIAGNDLVTMKALRGVLADAGHAPLADDIEKRLARPLALVQQHFRDPRDNYLAHTNEKRAVAGILSQPVKRAILREVVDAFCDVVSTVYRVVYDDDQDRWDVFPGVDRLLAGFAHVPPRPQTTIQRLRASGRVSVGAMAVDPDEIQEWEPELPLSRATADDENTDA